MLKSEAAAAVGFMHMVSAASNPENKYHSGPIAPVAALPCSNEERGSEAYKRKTGRNLLICTGLALQMKIGVFKLGTYPIGWCLTDRKRYSY